MGMNRGRAKKKGEDPGPRRVPYLGFIPSPGSPWQSPVLTEPTPLSGTPDDAQAFLVPKLETSVAALLADRAKHFDTAAKAKWEKMTRMHSLEWFKQSTNKELDERGSRASVSVEGLRHPNEVLAHTGLVEMASVAKDYFFDLHTPEPSPPERVDAQCALLQEAKMQGTERANPDPETVEDGPFMLEEMKALCSKMPNMAPGPDRIHYSSWKRLMSILDGLQKGVPPPRTFWSIFANLTKDIALQGSSREGFKDVNISLFYKKGDPTLVSNYRPISSMNADCKMYTNLLNSRLAPWAVAKLHPDQKGFVPGRLMNEHTRLAVEVAHLCDVTGMPGFIVGLDQAKAYNQVDQSWLLSVLVAFGLPKDLIVLIGDLIAGCRSRVQINSGYSPFFTLRQGVRQGDPLSCLLFNFSIEPLAIKLQQKVKGLQVPGLDPVKVMLYADDVNLFLGDQDSVQEISATLAETSFTIGLKFNLEKTDMKPVGPHTFQEKCYRDQDMAGSNIPGAHILPPVDPLCILGVWIGSRDNALHRWTQIDVHIKKIISQWQVIRASVRNRSLLAKALMLSRCHFLMDGNGIPPHILRQISNRIMGFVRGKFSAMSYGTLEAPLEEGGLNNPSLITRKYATNLKFFSDLVTRDQTVPWKKWTWMDMKMASTSSHAGTYGGMNPFLQQAYMKPTLLQDRVSQAFTTARRFGLDMASSAPSIAAQQGARILNHPALPRLNSHTFLKILKLRSMGISMVAHLYLPPPMPLWGTGLWKTVTRMQEVVGTSCWSIFKPRYGWPLGPDVNVWPNMDGPLGCIRIFTLPKSLITGRIEKDTYKKTRVCVYVEDYAPVQALAPRATGEIIYERDIHVWTDGLALDNGLDTCTAGSTWTSDLLFDNKVKITGAVLSNNMAEVAVVVLCLLAWRDTHVAIHTDSTFVLGLLKGGLLAMERDRWGDALRHMSHGPPTPLLQYLLYLLRDRTRRVSFVKAKAHGNDLNNNIADRLVNEGRVSGRILDIGALQVPAGWVDMAPVLCHQPLDYLMKLVMRNRMPVPAGTIKFRRFSDRWTVTIGTLFDKVLDPGRHIGGVWHLLIPEGLKEVLWKEMNSAQVLGTRYFSTSNKKSDMGQICPCGQDMSLGHILMGCARYDLQPLLTILLDTLRAVSPVSSFRTLHPDEWGSSPWYPLLALRTLEEVALPIFKGRKEMLKTLKASRPKQEWIIGNYYWMLWKWCMKEIHDDGFRFMPILCTTHLKNVLLTPCPTPDKKAKADDTDQAPEAKVRLTDNAYG